MDWPENPSASEKTLFKILAELHERRGLDFREYRKSFIERRVDSRLAVLKISNGDYAAYEKVLASSPGEWNDLFDTLTINVTEFFRDAAIWDYLEKNILHPLLSQPFPVTIWSAGCAGGEEPYSLAILLREISRLKTSPPPALIYASDVDPVALAQAKSAIYPAKSVLSLEERRRKIFFEKQKDGRYQVEFKTASLVRFKEHSYLEPPFIRGCQLILCRNSLIYLAKEAKDQALRNFHTALALGGILVLGATEVLVGDSYKAFFDTSAVHAGILRKAN